MVNLEPWVDMLNVKLISNSWLKVQSWFLKWPYTLWVKIEPRGFALTNVDQPIFWSTISFSWLWWGQKLVSWSDNPKNLRASGWDGFQTKMRSLDSTKSIYVRNITQSISMARDGYVMRWDLWHLNGNWHRVEHMRYKIVGMRFPKSVMFYHE